jgi:uncharacterized repeat protein (TIGR03803 family)
LCDLQILHTGEGRIIERYLPDRRRLDLSQRLLHGLYAQVVLGASLLASCSSGAGDGSLPQANAGAPSAARLAGERVLYSFKAGNDGGSPQGTLVADRNGALYGTTTFGGGGCFYGCGTVFKLTKSGSGYIESILYRFTGGNDGQGPGSGVIADASGALYGTTEYGGDSAGDGTVFKLTPSGSTYVESVLYRFKGGTDGDGPLAGLTMDRAGDLYGATLLGGNSPACGSGGSGNVGCGTIFELRRSGSAYTERVIYRFQSGADGATPGSPPIVVGRDMYGTAATGGGNPHCGGAPINPGCGTVYKLSRSGKRWKFIALYTFKGTPSDAANPFAGLVAGSNGALYGVGQYGGSANQGAAYELHSASSSEHVLHSFTGGSDGSYPTPTLSVSRAGTLYGTSEYGGGPANAGVVFSMTPSGSERVLLAFSSKAGGEYPVGGILVGAKGVLFGTATYGGSASAAGGVVFRL